MNAERPLGPDASTANGSAGSLRAYRARYVFPGPAAPIRNGVVTVTGDGERIVEVGTHSDTPAVDLGNVALVPGLVNAHTHLEFSSLGAPFSAEGTFADWIRRVVAYRRSLAADPEQVALAVLRGLRECRHHEVCTLGEIATPGWPRSQFAETLIDVTVFAELLGLGAARIEPNVALAEEHLGLARSETTRGGDLTWRTGLSPHAPYTVHQELFARAVALAARDRAPLAFHLAETREELELLRHGTGPLRELLDEFGVWDPGAIAPGTRPLDYLKQLAQAPRTLIIHGNYLDDDEMAEIARQRERMSVVYCPRTHEHFRHEPHPVERLLAAGVRVALGTDSRASNPDLSLLAEIRAVARRHPGISPCQALAMGTQAGAEALGLGEITGTIAPGKRADLTVVPLPTHDAVDPYELLLE